MPPPNSKPLTSLYWSLIVSAVLAALLVVATVWLGIQTQTQEKWIRHTLGVHNQLAQLVTLVQSAETGQRGYLLTGRDTYLRPYEAAVSTLPAAIDETAVLLADNPQQQQALTRLRQLISNKLGELRTTIEERKAGQQDAALAIVNSDRGMQMMSEIRRLLSSMEDEENRLLSLRQSTSATLSTLLQIGAGAAFLLICAVCALASFLTRRSFAQLAATHDELVATHQQLLAQVSEREYVESQLRQSQKMEAIGHLSGGIAHDFNNMLGVIAGSLDLMRRRIDKGDFGVEPFLNAASKAAERAAALTHRLLAFARQQPLAPKAIDANRMIANMSQLLSSTLGEHIRIEAVSAAGLWAVSADPHQLESAILNIAINARDAMPEGGKLTIETANAYLDEAYCSQHTEIEPGQFVMLAISDTGSGMRPEIVLHAFDPFFTTKPAGKGTGLGLSQVYGFVKQSRGHVKIYSEIGAGTTVKIYLPRMIDAATVVPPVPTSLARPGRPGEAILVVEDDLLMRKLTTEALRELGYTVYDAEDANAALTILDGTPEIKLLFTDVVMPEINGKELADMASHRRPDLKVMFTTGYTPNAVVHGGVLDQGVNFISKPFTLDRLATKVRSILDG